MVRRCPSLPETLLIPSTSLKELPSRYDSPNFTLIFHKDLHETIRKGNLRKDKLDEAIKTQKKDFPKGISECGTDALR